MIMIDYKSAGVNIEAGNEAVNRIKDSVESTFPNAVLTPLGSFGALYDLQAIMRDYQQPVLVQSIDGVGTKTIIARMMQKFDTLGMDLVSATANDIIVLGAKPLTLLDYIANDKLQPDIIEDLVGGMVKACRQNDISLVGGETAEMPGTYLPGEHDLVGVITGVVEKEKVITGKTIQPGDTVFGLTSSGLHTNGYSLARKLLFDVEKFAIDRYFDELQKTIGEALLEPHINYTRPILQLLQQYIPIKGMAHITGGGLLENVPRILPNHCSVEIRKNAWPASPLFSLLCQLGHLSDQESYRTFNMGIGMVLIGEKNMFANTDFIFNQYPEFQLFEIGTVIPGPKKVTLV
ncbi:MAG TPA: phosphoribosylformylglycinamidine cyclo-ligase [Gammaproteobacteria bacterium]|nr:phosphoribosylformylglycinamidine cyclo-ligase [Gammaproteobacteria bacterium]